MPRKTIKGLEAALVAAQQKLFVCQDEHEKTKDKLRGAHEDVHLAWKIVGAFTELINR